MLTQCPKCETVYQIAKGQLEARDGLVRCGRCRNVFNAAWNLLDAPPTNHLPDPEPETQPAMDDEQADWIKRLHEELAEEFKPTVVEGERTTPPLPAAEPVPAPVPEPAIIPEEDTATQDEAPADNGQWGWGIGGGRQAPRAGDTGPQRIEPSLAGPARAPDPFALHAPDEEIVLETPVDADEWRSAMNAEPDLPPAAPAAPAGRGGRRAAAVREVTIPLSRAPARRSHRKWWITGAAVLSVLVVLQLFYFFFDRLANVEVLRPILEQACEVLGCELPARKAQGLVDLLNSHIASSPQRSDALRVSATLVNRADFRQDFPQLEVALTNNQGELIARTTFSPQQYLGAGAQSLPLMPPNVAIAVRMDVSRPLDEAVGYEVALVAEPGAGARPDIASMGNHVLSSTGAALRDATGRVREFLRDLGA